MIEEESTQKINKNNEVPPTKVEEESKKLQYEDLNFEKLPPPDCCPRLNLTPQQKKTVAENLPALQNIIHYMFWSEARYNGRDGYILLNVLTGNMITIFQQSISRLKSKASMSDISKDDRHHKKSEKKQEKSSNNKQDYDFDIKLLKQINLTDLLKIGYDPNPKQKSVLLNAVKKEKPVKEEQSESGIKTQEKINIQYKKDDKGYNLTFAQCIYRNYYFNFYVLRATHFVEVLTDNINDCFPDLDIHLSPSQCFQFLYYAKCSESKAEYNQQVVQYIHSLVLLGMPIVDISKLPLISKKNTDLEPIFQALSDQEFVCGICCSKVKLPNLMDSIKYIFHQSSKINILHFEDCDMKSGIKRLLHYVKKDRSKISYWNLRKNKFKDIEYFIKILEFTNTNLYFLDLSSCGLSEKFMKDLYQALARFPSLQQLYIAESKNSQAVADEFDNLLTKYESSGPINLRTLDLSKVEDIDNYLMVLNKHNVPLRSLIISDVSLTNESKELENFISKSTTLKSLDLSGIKCNRSFLVKILKALYKNDDLNDFDLHMKSLKLTSGNWVPIISALIYGSTLETKWNLLSLDSNNMTKKDLMNIIPLLAMMNLRSLSLNNNFTSEMTGIGETLAEIVEKCPGLEKLYVAGDDDHKLGSEINILLNKIADSCISEINFSNNNAGDEFYNILKTVIKKRNTDDPECIPLSHISIDGNGLSSISTIEEISKLIQNRSVTKFDFPSKDCQAILEKADQGKTSLRKQISKAQIALVQAVNMNRANEKMLPDLPFRTTKEMRSLIQRMTKKMREKISKEDPFRHTEFCDDLGLPLPYQEMGSIVKNGGTEEGDPELEDKVKYYHSDSISKSIVEKTDVQFIKKDDQDIEFKFDSITESENIVEEEEELENTSKKVDFDFNNTQDVKEEENKDDELDSKEEKKEDEDQNKEEDEEKKDDIEEIKEVKVEDVKKKKKNEEEDENDKMKKKKRKGHHEEEEYDEDNDKSKRKKSNRRRHSRKHSYNDEYDEYDDTDKTKNKKNKYRRRSKNDEYDDEYDDYNRTKSKKKKSHRRSRNDEYDDEYDEYDSKRKSYKKKSRKTSKHGDSEDYDNYSPKKRRKSSRHKKYDDDEDGKHNKKRSNRQDRTKAEYDDDKDYYESQQVDKNSNKKKRLNTSNSKSQDDNKKDDFSEYSDEGNANKRSTKKSQKQQQQKDNSDSDEEHPISAKNKKTIEEETNSNDIDNESEITEEDDKLTENQDDRMGDEMDNFILTSSRNLGTFRVPKLAKTQKTNGKRQLPPSSMNASQRKPKIVLKT